MDAGKFKKIARVLLLLWFILIGLLVLVPSGRLLFGGRKAPLLGKTPVPPDPPSVKDVTWIDPKEPAATLTQRVEVYKQQASIYAQLVQVYEKQVTAYGKYLDQRAKDSCNECPPKPSEEYSLIVKDTVAPMVNNFLAALFVYIFVNAGAQLITNYLRAKNNQTIEEIRLL
jgi:hypothetical protein